MSWYQMKATGDKAAQLILDGQIGWDVTTADFRRDLKALGDLDAIDMRVNSPGGSVIDGFAIYNMLLDHPAKIKATVEGWAASMGSIITCAADEIHMPANAWWMIHNPWTMAMGESDDLRQMADIMDRMKKHAIAAYQRHIDVDADTLSAWMDAETWLDGADAQGLGWNFTFDEAIEVAASILKPDYQVPEAAAAWINIAKPTPTHNEEPNVDTTDTTPENSDVAQVNTPVTDVATDDAIETPAAAAVETPGAPVTFSQDHVDAAVADAVAMVTDKHTEAIVLLRSEIATAEARAQSAEDRLERLLPGAATAPPMDQDEMTWTQALEKCDGDYAKARAKYPTVYQSFRDECKAKRGQSGFSRFGTCAIGVVISIALVAGIALADATSVKSYQFPNLVKEINAALTILNGVLDASNKLDGEQIADDTIDDDSIDFADVTGADLTLTDAGAITSSGTVTAGVGFDVTGAADMDYGSADVTDHTFTSDGTGDAEVVLPDDSIGDDEIDWSGMTTSADLTVTGTLIATVGLDTVGAADMDYGSVDVTDHTFTTDDCTVIVDGGVTVSTGDNIAIGAVTWNSSDNIDGEVIADNTIDDDSIDFADVTGADLTLTDAGAITSSGTITAAVGFDVTGAADMDYGSADVTDHTFTSDGTGDAEIVLPNESIGTAELGFPRMASISEAVAVAGFTDNTDATGYIDLSATVEANAIIVGWKAEVTGGFGGDTTAVIQVGVAGTLDAYSADTTQSVFAIADVGSASLAASSYTTATTTIRVTVTGASDFGLIVTDATGAATITVYYLETE